MGIASRKQDLTLHEGSRFKRFQSHTRADLGSPCGPPRTVVDMSRNAKEMLKRHRLNSPSDDYGREAGEGRDA